LAIKFNGMRFQMRYKSKRENTILKLFERG
jgi:hypothetical protein